MPRAIQPTLFEFTVLVAPPTLGERLRELALIANAACVETARRVTQEAALGWWDAMVAAAGGRAAMLRAAQSPSVGLDLPRRTIEKARALGGDLAVLPVAEANALLGRLYTHGLPGAHRAAHGIFYTPPI